ncbi:PepSY-associated TM helix domain-containing protein [Roseimarinus sediminis]|uniref:PepSY-associated TM helix domain-containing protein n=1 Tax=Roseimarinus sediminis TaxID=1610899 RepID=UPI003D205F21
MNRKIHLWLGLVSGLLVFLISISGAMYAFRDEIYNKVHRQHRYVDQAGLSPLPLDALWKIAQDTLGENAPIDYVNTFAEADRAWEFKAYHHNPEKVSYFNWCEYDWLVYINPYNGEVLKVLNHKYEFFQLVKMFHWSFLLNTRYGQPIVGYTVLLFVIGLLSGLLLWWPFGKKAKKQAFVIRPTRKWKVLNRDIHNVLGFYSIPFTLLLSFTGMVWAFKWFMALVVVVANFSTALPESKSSLAENDEQMQVDAIYDKVYQNSVKRHPEAYSIMIRSAPGASFGPIGTYVKESEPVYYKAWLENFNPYTGELIDSKGFGDLSRGEKLISMNYDIHVGAILGLPGKIIAFFIALLAASMPISGFLIWWYRIRPKRKIKIDF